MTALHREVRVAGMPAPALSRVALRPLRPEDDALYPDFLERVSAEDRRLRFFTPARLSTTQIHGLTHYDPASARAFAAVDGRDGALLGVGRLHRIGAGEGEFAVLVRSDLKGKGLGRRLLDRLIETAPTLGISRIVGLILRENTGMLALARELGFTVGTDVADPTIVRASLDLDVSVPLLQAA